MCIPDELVQTLRRASRVAALTGAGTSAESDVPTFRDSQSGLWARYRPEDLATTQAFQRNPRLVWEWYAWRRELIDKAFPNPGHYALAEMERKLPNMVLITQNVDSMHQQAGSQEVIELHGNIRRTKCFQEGIIIPTWEETDAIPPRCPQCGGPLRPDVVWFGEGLPQEALRKAWLAARECQVFFSIGTSTLVQPAASLPLVAQEAGAMIVEINPSPTPLTHTASYTLQGPSGKMLPALVEAVWGERSAND